MKNQRHIEVDVSQLKHFERNPRSHNQHQINELCKSLDKFGLYQELVCDENLNVLVGNARLDAAIKMNIPKVRVCIIEGLSEKDKKKIVLADNKIFQMGTVNFEFEKELIKEIGEIDIPGYNEEFLNLILDVKSFDPMEAFTPMQEKTPSDAPVSEKKDASVYLSEQMPTQTMQEEKQPEIPLQKYIICPHCGNKIDL